MKIFRLVSLLTVAIVGSMAFADELNYLSPYLSPIVGTGSVTGRTVAVVFPHSNAAQVVFLDEGKVEVGSREFEFPMRANCGALSVEQIDVHSAASFTLRVRSRQTCGSGI